MGSIPDSSVDGWSVFPGPGFVSMVDTEGGLFQVGVGVGKYDGVIVVDDFHNLGEGSPPS